jgi:lipopolysaccharide transport system ATP-binding protein
MTNAIISNNLCKTYFLYRKPVDRLKQAIFKTAKYRTEFQALKNASFTLQKGQTLGILGRNGSGKSTLLKILSGILQPTSGSYKVSGRVSALLELGAGFDPEFSGHENIFLNAAILGMSDEEIKQKYDAIVEFSGIREHIHHPVKTYSSGMYIRLAFSVAIASDPEILIVDEALAVGDERFQRKCFERLRQMQQAGCAIIFVSHSPRLVLELCDKAMLMDSGEILMISTPKDVVTQYHRLIFAPDERADIIRNEIKNYGEVKVEKGIEAKDEEPQEEMHEKGRHIALSADFDPNMKPESTDIKSSDAIAISQIRIENLKREQVNLLVRRETYILKFQAHASQDIIGLRFNMRINTGTGIIVSGASTGGFDTELLNIEKGKNFEVSFRFNCLLMPQTYFISVTANSLTEGERIPIHRITDALMIKVLPEKDLHISGLADLMVESDITVSSSS